MTIAEMDFPVAAAIRAALTDVVARSDLGYAVPATTGLRLALSDFAGHRLNWQVDSTQISVVPDVMLGLIELALHLAGPDGTVGFAVPAYPPFRKEFTRVGLGARPIRLGPDGALDLDDLDAALAGGLRVLVLSNPHNPTGRTLPRSELAAIADRCAERGVWVLADEIHAPLVLPGATHVPFLEASDEARRWGIALTSASKAFNLAALKTAFIVTAHGAARDAVVGMGPQDDHASLLGEIAAEVAFREGEPWLDAVIDQLAVNRTLLAELLRDELPGVRWTAPEATYLAWLDFREVELGDDPADVLLRRGRLALGRGLDYGEPGAGHARLNFATSPEHLTDAVSRMHSSVQSEISTR